MKTYIHVNQHIIKRNFKTGEDDPVLTFKTYKSNDYASEINIKGDCKIIYRSIVIRLCGAKVWIETNGVVEVVR